MTAEPLPIALCITDLDAGGAERCLTRLATRLDRGRFHPVVYCLGPPPARTEASCLPELEGAGIETHCLDGRGKWDFPRVRRRLVELLRKQKPELLQTFLFHANVVGRLAARKAGVPRVVSGIRVAERGSRWHLWIDRRTERLVDRHVCVSQSVARFSAEQAGLPADKLVVISNGIDLDAYPAPCPADLSKLGLPPGRGTVTYVGRLDRQKGVGWLVESATDWLASAPDCDLLLVGTGPEEAALRTMCQKLGIADRIHFAGWRTDVPEILAASRMLVLPSRWEGMPNVVLEAMASGLPVVSTRAEGVEELLGPAAADQTVDFGDFRALSGRILALLGDSTATARLGAANRARAEQCFSLTAMVEAYQRLWESLVRG